MSLSTVQEIEQAIDSLSPHELEELFGWLDQHRDPFEERVAADLKAGHLDAVIREALDDIQNGRTRPL